MFHNTTYAFLQPLPTCLISQDRSKDIMLPEEFEDPLEEEFHDLTDAYVE